MKNIFAFVGVLAILGVAEASWYWPFGEESDQPRVSDLMRDATALIDEAKDLSDRIADGVTNDYACAVSKYREALAELTRIEAENPDRASTPAFSSLRNKKAYVSAAIDSLLLAEARANAKAVAVTDTTELEKQFVGRRKETQVKEKPLAGAPEGGMEKPANQSKKSSVKRLVKVLDKDPGNRKLRLALIGEYIRLENYEAAKREIGVLLKDRPTDSSALNLRAICEASQGEFKTAEDTLFISIRSNPRDYNGYYNMANLKLQDAQNRDAAKLYYETGRRLGGPKDRALEEAFK